jgi:catechol 2,3-dioxygenase-like lactoylglutathione lyase family enzyme
MKLRPSVLEFVVADMAVTLAFYRRLGLDILLEADDQHLEPWDAFWGMRYAVVRDPDGTPVDLFARLPAVESRSGPAREADRCVGNSLRSLVPASRCVWPSDEQPGAVPQDIHAAVGQDQPWRRGRFSGPPPHRRACHEGRPIRVGHPSIVPPRLWPRPTGVIWLTAAR